MWIFYALTIAVLFLCLRTKTRERLLAMPRIAAAESSLSRLTAWLAAHEKLCFLFIFAAGIAVRTWKFGILPLGQNQDGTMGGVEAWCLLKNGVDHWGHSWPTYFEAWGVAQMSVLYSLIMIPFVMVLGLTKLALRLPMLIISLVSLLLIWDLARRAMGRGYALLALLLAAVNPWQILQSRWAIDCNLMPHVLLLAFWLLWLGKDRRWALYLSMVAFGLTTYSYGTAVLIVPEILLLAAVLYAIRGWVKPLDVVVCVLLFVMVSGPYLLTLAIQTFDWDTLVIGPFTLPRFTTTQRATDIALFADNPYERIITNITSFLEQFMLNRHGEEYNAISWANTLYPFMTPVWLCGLYLWWRSARRACRNGKQETNGEEILFRLLLFWLIGSTVNGMMISGMVNRQNTVFYPLIFVSAYGILEAGKRMRTAGAALTVMLCIAFGGLVNTYFFDERYQNSVGQTFHDGYQEALSATKDWDYDHYYILDGSAAALTQLMFAHGLDYAEISEERDLPDREGNPSGWYFTDRYIFVSGKPDLNPTDCAVYIFPKEKAKYFNTDEYQITEYGLYCAAYPRYWL